MTVRAKTTEARYENALFYMNCDKRNAYTLLHYKYLSVISMSALCIQLNIQSEVQYTLTNEKFLQTAMPGCPRYIILNTYGFYNAVELKVQ